MKDQRPEILYSDPVKEIMGRPPRRILRWGTSIMLIIFVLFILFALLIKYPDTIPAPVEITTTNPPVTLVTKITGHINSFFVKEREKVSAGQLVAVMETTASLNEIELLKQTIDTIKEPELQSYRLLPLFSNLGELQGYYGKLDKCNKVLKDGSYMHNLKKLKSEFESVKINYNEKDRIFIPANAYTFKGCLSKYKIGNSF